MARQRGAGNMAGGEGAGLNTCAKRNTARQLDLVTWAGVSMINLYLWSEIWSEMEKKVKSCRYIASVK